MVADVSTSKTALMGTGRLYFRPQRAVELKIWQAIKKLLHPACQTLRTGFEESIHPVYLHFVFQWFLSRHCLEGELEEGIESSLEVGSKLPFPETQKLHQKENAVDYCQTELIIVKLNGERSGCSFQC